MKTNLEVKKTKKGIILYADVKLSIEITISPVDEKFKYIGGADGYSMHGLWYRKPFDNLRIKTIPLKNLREAEEANKEIKELFEILEYKEKAQIHQLISIEKYLKNKCEEIVYNSKIQKIQAEVKEGKKPSRRLKIA